MSNTIKIKICCIQTEAEATMAIEAGAAAIADHHRVAGTSTIQIV